MHWSWLGRGTTWEPSEMVERDDDKNPGVLLLLFGWSLGRLNNAWIQPPDWIQHCWRTLEKQFVEILMLYLPETCWRKLGTGHAI